MQRSTLSSSLLVSLIFAVPACGSSSPPAGNGGPKSGGPHPALPQLVDQGVGVLTAPKIVTVTFPGDANAAQLETFGAGLTTSNWWNTVRQGYCTTGSTTSCVGNGPPGTKVEITAAPGASYTDTQHGGASSLQTYIQGLIPAQIPQPDAQTILVFFFPASTTILLDGAASCQVFAGFHNFMTAGGVQFSYAVVNECPPQPPSKLTVFQQSTFAASHEVFEATTDPSQVQTGTTLSLGYYLNFNDPASLPWNGVGGGETGDMCVDFLQFGQDQTVDGAFTYQRIWSNAAAAAGKDPCVPAVTTPYFNVAPETWLERLAVGTSATFTADAFSTAKVPGWTLIGFDLNATSATNLSPYVAVTVNGGRSAIVNDGDRVTVSVTLNKDPSDLPNYKALPGAVGLLISINSTNPATATAGHFWPFFVTSKTDAVSVGLDQVDAAADLPLRPRVQLTHEQRSNFARVFPNLRLE